MSDAASFCSPNARSSTQTHNTIFKFHHLTIICAFSSWAMAQTATHPRIESSSQLRSFDRNMAAADAALQLVYSSWAARFLRLFRAALSTATAERRGLGGPEISWLRPGGGRGTQRLKRDPESRCDVC